MTEAEQTESEDKFRTIFLNSPYPITLNRASDGTIIAVNPAFLTASGYREDEVIGRDPVKQGLIDQDTFRKAMDLIRKEGKVESLPMMVTGKDGSNMHILLSALPVSFGNEPAIMTMTVDLTLQKNVQDVLRESERKFTTIFTHNPTSLAVVSAKNGVFVDVNDAFVRSTGYGREEVIGKTAKELGLYLDSDEYMRFVTSLQKWQDVHAMEMTCRNKDGKTINGLMSSCFVIMKGKPYILSSFEDITDRKSSEIAFQTLFKSIVGITGRDALRTIAENVCSWLHADCVMIGKISPEKETVTVLSMLLDGNEVSGFSYALSGTPCETVVKNGFCISPDNIDTIYPLTAAAAPIQIKGYMGTPLYNSAGEIFGILCVLFRDPIHHPPPNIREFLEIIAVKASADIERIQIENAFLESQRKLAGAMDIADLVNWEYDVKTGFFTFDDRFYALYKTTKEEEGGIHMTPETYAREFIPPEDRDVVLEEEKKALETSDPFYQSQREHRIIRRDGEIRYIQVRIGVVKDESGRTIKTYGANQDITERKKTEESLRMANRQLNLLNGITRHDILNGITIILSYLEFADMICRDPEMGEYLTKIELATKSIKDQIEFTRIYQDLGAEEPQWQDITSIISRLSVPDTVAIHTDCEGVSVYGDPMLEKVFYNLLDNAVRHGERVTRIQLSRVPCGTDLLLVWEDNGIGIPDEEKEQIFSRGYGRNTGYGMFLAREILALTGSSITETGIMGKGARFEILVPKGFFRINPL